MLMRRARANSNSCSQVILVYFHLFRRNSLFCSQKITKTFHFLGSRLFKNINVNILKKLVASACYDKRHVCAYLQPFCMLDKPTADK